MVPRTQFLVKLICPECGKLMVLREGKYSLFYGCDYPYCKATHTAHPDGRPLGIPADNETRGWRVKAHLAFDTALKRCSLSRNQAYRSLARTMGMSRSECHIGRFGIEECKRVIKILVG